MAEYIDKEAVDKTLCDFIRELNRASAGIESSAVFEALARVRYIPAADVRENVIRTQADRIRGMSDEELAEFLENHCYQYGWLDWLKQEVEE